MAAAGELLAGFPSLPNQVRGASRGPLGELPLHSRAFWGTQIDSGLNPRNA